MKFISPEEKLKTIGFKFSKESQQSTFQFVKKDFNCQKTKDDAQYRWERFRDLYDAVAPKLGSRFDVAKNDIGLKAETSKRKSSYFGRYNKRGEKVYCDYTWFGILLVTPEPNASKAKKDFQFPSRDTVQFQIGLNPRDPLWAGIYIGRASQNKKTRERMLSLLKNEPEECIKRFKDLSEYMIRCVEDTDDDNTKVVGEWKTSELDKDIIAEIFKTYSQKDIDFYVCKIFTKVEALES